MNHFREAAAAHDPAELVQGTAIALGARAALIRGPPGTGKSDLALRCLLHPVSALIPEPALLVADDCVLVQRVGERLVPGAPDAIRGKLEVRGLGIVDVPAATSGTLSLVLVVDLVERERIPRLPDPHGSTSIQGIRVPVLAVTPAESSAPGKVLLALARGLGSAR